MFHYKRLQFSNRFLLTQSLEIELRIEDISECLKWFIVRFFIISDAQRYENKEDLEQETTKINLTVNH